MKPFLDDSDVNIDDVAGLQDFPVTRNTMTDHMINGGAYRFGKSVVVERRRNGSLVVNDVIMAQSVQFAGADSGLHMGPIISSTSAASRPATRIFSISSGFLMWMLMIVGNADEMLRYRYSKSAVSARTALPPKACQIAESGLQAVEFLSLKPSR